MKLCLRPLRSLLVAATLAAGAFSAGCATLKADAAAAEPVLKAGEQAFVACILPKLPTEAADLATMQDSAAGAIVVACWDKASSVAAATPATPPPTAAQVTANVPTVKALAASKTAAVTARPAPSAAPSGASAAPTGAK